MARVYSTEHIAALQNLATLNQDAEVVNKIAAQEGGEDTQCENLFRFEEEAARKKKIGGILDKMDQKRYADVHKRRLNPDPIIRVRCTKLTKEKYLQCISPDMVLLTNTLKSSSPASSQSTDSANGSRSKISSQHTRVSTRRS